MFLQDFERPPFHHNGGIYVAPNAPWKLVLHTTEGLGGVDGQAAFMDRTGDYPHFIADPIAKRRAQILDMDRSCTGLVHSGMPETNRLNCLQVEIVWFAGRIKELTAAQLIWLGAYVVAPICKAKNIKLVPPPRPFVDAAASPARTNAPQRLSAAEWINFNGVCGHQHVPENEHWDPGALDITTVLAAARNALSLPPLGSHNTQEDNVSGLTVVSQYAGSPKGRRAVGTLVPGIKAVLLRNGAHCRGEDGSRDIASQDPRIRVWKVPSNSAVTDIAPLPEGGGFVVTAADGGTFVAHWTKK